METSINNSIEKQRKLFDEKPLLFVLKFSSIFGLLFLIALFLQRILSAILSPSPLFSLISSVFIGGFFLSGSLVQRSSYAD